MPELCKRGKTNKMAHSIRRLLVPAYLVSTTSKFALRVSVCGKENKFASVFGFA
jgi:hypothetical protein